MAPVLILVGILVLVWLMSGGSAEVEETVAEARARLPAPLVSAPPTTTVGPDLSHVPSAASMTDAKIELYTGKDFAGDKKTLYPGQKTQFAEMTSSKTLAWTYQSMKIVPGTYIMLTSTVGGGTDRGFAVGKYDVPDMFAFIQSYDSLYDQSGIFMDRDYWARPFYIRVLRPDQWDKERAIKYEDCMSQATGGWDYSEEKAKEFCVYAEPEENMANITGFRSGRRSGYRSGCRSGFRSGMPEKPDLPEF